MIEQIETGTDTVRSAVETTASTVGRIAGIITNAIVDVTKELGELATDAFEIAEGVQKRTQKDA